MSRFTSAARNGLRIAQQEAEFEQAATIDTRHLLIGLAQLPIGASTAAHVLNGLGVTPEKLNAAPSESATGETPQIPVGDGVKKTLERAVRAAQQRNEIVLASAHLLVSLLEDTNAVQILETLGIAKEQVRAVLDSLPIWTKED
jgi:ATP-dependent Clp protease ATP-binding subunit ClpC